MRKFASVLLSLGAGALLFGLPTTPASADPVLQGTVFQVELTDVYVEGPDHTAVRVPGDAAVFLVDGVPTDYCDLKIGSKVTVQYQPGLGTSSTYPRNIQVTGTENYQRDTIVNGTVMRHLWSNGKWTRLP